MGRNTRVNLFWFWLSLGVGLVLTSNFCIGVVLIVFSFIWLYLFVLPFSPVKRYWWSASDKIVIVNMQYAGFGARGNTKYITVYAEWRPRSRIIVSEMYIKIQ